MSCNPREKEREGISRRKYLSSGTCHWGYAPGESNYASRVQSYPGGEGRIALVQYWCWGTGARLNQTATGSRESHFESCAIVRIPVVPDRQSRWDKIPTFDR